MRKKELHKVLHRREVTEEVKKNQPFFAIFIEDELAGLQGKRGRGGEEVENKFLKKSNTPLKKCLAAARV